MSSNEKKKFWVGPPPKWIYSVIPPPWWSTPPPSKHIYSEASISSAPGSTAEAVSPPPTAATAPSVSSKSPDDELIAAMIGTAEANLTASFEKMAAALKYVPSLSTQEVPTQVWGGGFDVQRLLKKDEEYTIVTGIDDVTGCERVLHEGDIFMRNREEFDLLYKAIPEAARNSVIDFLASKNMCPTPIAVITFYNDQVCKDPEKWFQDALELTL